MRIYAESSAILSWLFGETDGRAARQWLAEAEDIFTSTLTLVETDRVLIRAQVLEDLAERAVIERRRMLAAASRHWHLVQLVGEVLDRARRPFPGEPIRTLDALHLASAMTIRSAVPELALLTLDNRVRSSAEELGFRVLPNR